MGFVSLKYDFAFKHLMSNEEVRKYFISDVLGIPVGEIRSVRLVSPFLWKRFMWQKQGILDIHLLLNDESKVNIELQIRAKKYWDKRAMFYLAKMFTEELVFGEDFSKLKKCVGISILDFDLNDSPEYHRVYRLRDKAGKDFTDILEVHIIELGKKLDGNRRLDDWIRLLNAEKEEDIAMIKTDNPGILEAMREVRIMGLGRSLRMLYEMRMKEIRDRKAEDDYVRDEGIAIGEARGIEIGEARGIEIGEARGIEIGETRGERRKLISQVRKKVSKNVSPEETAALLEEDTTLIRQIHDLIQAHPEWDDERICQEIE